MTEQGGLLTDIEELLEQGAGNSPSSFTAADVERRARTRHDRRRAMSGAALLVVLGLGLAGVAALTGDRDQPVATSPDASTSTSAPSTSTGEPDPHVGTSDDTSDGTRDDTGLDAGASATIEVHFAPEFDGDCSATEAVFRSVSVGSTTTELVAAALEELLAGPTAEEQTAGLASWFSDETAGMLRSVEVIDGIAHVDFDGFAHLLNNASTTCGSASLMSSLNSTVTQFAGIETAVYYFDGDADAFYYWLQGTAPPEARPELFSQ